MKEHFERRPTSGPVEPDNKNENETMSRRAFFSGVAASIGVGLYSASLLPPKESESHGESNGVTNQPKQGEEQTESAEVFVESPVYDSVIKARVIEAIELARDQVQFVDKFGRPLGEPVTLTVPMKTVINEDGSKTLMPVGYSVPDLTLSYGGGKPLGIPPSWSRVQKELVSQQTGIPVDEINMLHIYQDLAGEGEEAYTSRVELVYHNAHEIVESDAKQRDAITLLRETATFPTIPEPLAGMLQKVMVGIACEESRFNEKKTSPAGAIGVLQTMPKMVKKYMTDNHIATFNMRNLDEQISVSVYHIESCYDYFMKKIPVELESICNSWFGGNEVLFQKYFVFPLIINAYNAGQKRMSEVVQWFVDMFGASNRVSKILDSAEPPTGYDIYFAMVWQCVEDKAVKKFGPGARSYTEKVLGWEQSYETYEKKIRVEQTASL